MPDLLANLNPEQLAAVTLPNEPALILAGAGSGKTRVLITRIAWLIQQGYASPPTILAVTFTNKAAREMMARLSALLPIDTRGMWIGTFHGLCNRMLRAHFRDAGLPQTFQILDTADQLSAIKRLMKGLNIDDEKYPAKNLQYFINNAKEQGLRPKDVDATDAFNRKFVELYEAYDQQCQREGVVDFPELLLRCYELLAHNPPLRAHYQARFRNILVDEFQDTNKLQYAWLKLLAGEHNAIFAVGDDDQSIYAFRGANVGNMHDFEREFNVRNLIKLEQNYRSHGHILDTANLLIANNSRRLGKNLRTDAGHGEPVRVYEAATDSQEAGWIVEEIKALINTGPSRGEIAMLYRSNAQSRTIEHTLVNAGIPYRVYGGLRFFERQEVKHALAYLRLIDNPNDDTAFARVVNFPTRGIGARSIEQLADAARLYNCSMAAAVPYVTGKAGSSLGSFATLIAKMRAETQQMSLPETVEYVIRASGLAAHYENEREGQDRLENLQEVVNAAAAFVSEEGYGLDTPARSIPLRPGATAAPEIALATDDPGVDVLDAADPADPAQNPDTMTPLAGFLSHASLEAGDNQAQAGQDAVQLMTVHAAKGLEFTAVFITGLEEGLVPAREQRAGNATGWRKSGGWRMSRSRGRRSGCICRSRRAGCCTARRATTSARASSTNCPKARSSGSRRRSRRARAGAAGRITPAGAATGSRGRCRERSSPRYVDPDAGAPLPAFANDAARGRYRLQGRPAGVSHEVRRRHGDGARRLGRRCARASALQAPRREVARAGRRETAGGRMTVTCSASWRRCRRNSAI